MTTSRSEAGTEVIRIVAALVMNADGESLLVRKRGTSTFMQPGGKLLEGEEPLQALERELREELGCGVTSSELLGSYTAPAANEPGATVEAQIFKVTLAGQPCAQAEIDEAVWVDPDALDGLAIAPLSRTFVMPIARAMKAPA